MEAGRWKIELVQVPAEELQATQQKRESCSHIINDVGKAMTESKCSVPENAAIAPSLKRSLSGK
jgi:hypothetical protein